MTEKPQLPLRDLLELCNKIHDERLLRILYKQTKSKPSTFEQVVDDYNELAPKLSGYNVQVNPEGTHFVFETEEEMIMCKLQYGQ